MMIITRWMGGLIKIWDAVLDIFFPPLCLSCRRYLDQPEKPDLLCAKCLNGVDVYNFPFRLAPDFMLAAAGSYENAALRALIHYFKYERFLAAEKPLSEIMIKHLEIAGIQFSDATIVPVPLHPKRLRARGFNQSELIAAKIAVHFDLEMKTGLLRRIRNTAPQMEIENHEERHKNVRKSFEVPAERVGSVKGRVILLVDDVYTSGATMTEAVKTLRRAGASKVIGAVLAKAG